MKPIELNILDRVTLSTILAEKESGSRIEMTLVSNILRDINFTPKEIEECSISDHGNALTFKKDCLITVEFSEQQVEIIESCLKKADHENRIHLQMIPFWDKFDATFKN